MTPLVISPGLIQTRTGAGLAGWQLAKALDLLGWQEYIAVCSSADFWCLTGYGLSCMPFLEFAGRPGYKMRGAWPRIEMSARIGRNRKSLDAGQILPIASVYELASQAALPCRVCGVWCECECVCVRVSLVRSLALASVRFTRRRPWTAATHRACVGGGEGELQGHDDRQQTRGCPMGRSAMSVFLSCRRPVWLTG